MTDDGGRLAVFLPGLGAVATTFVAGVELLKRGRAAPVGSVTQLGLVRRGDEQPVRVRDLLPLCRIEALSFGAWDIVGENAAAVAARSAVLSEAHLAEVRVALERLSPRPGVHDPELVRRIRANHVVAERHHREKVEVLRRDIQDMKRELKADRAVMVHCGSTEGFRPLGQVHESLRAFERGLDASDPSITPTMLYAYASLSERVPFANGTPNHAVEVPALEQLARAKGVPIAGRDFKTGQTMLKTAIAPALKARLLGLKGWFSTNILGNRDGEVLDDPQCFRSKEVTKTGVLDAILEPSVHPELYGEVSHKISIHYYPPRGDAKEGWDNVDLFGWLGYPMQIKVNFLCRDSILAAPLVLDLALLLDVAARAGRSGVQDWLSFYFKSPMPAEGRPVEHDLFCQRERLDAELFALADELSRRPERLRP